MAVNTMDEEQPLLRTRGPAPVGGDWDKQGAVCNVSIDIESSEHATSPKEWPAAFKWTIVALLAVMTFTVTFTCISVVPVANRIVYDLSGGGADKSASVLLVTVWELGEAAGPLFIAPLSESYGRYPVLNAANALFIAATLLAATCQSVPLFISARVLTGLAVATNVLGPAIVGDMFVSDQRGSAMSLIMLASLVGGAVGPAISGALADCLGWRQVLFLAAGLAIACEALFLTYFRETYVIIRQGHDPASAKLSSTDKAARWQGLRSSFSRILRPAAVLFGSGVLLAIAVYGSVVYAYFYVLCVSLPDILEDIYDLPPALAGSCFLSFSIGSFISIVICNLSLDRIYIKLRDKNQGVGHPEYRLPLSVIGGLSLPLSVALYGWAAQLHLPLPLLLISVGLIGLTLLLAYVPITAFVVDAFGPFAASAMTGVIVMRCLAGTFLPLTLAPLVGGLGYGWGFTILGVLAFVLAPVPMLIMRYGSRWRQWSEYTREA